MRRERLKLIWNKYHEAGSATKKLADKNLYISDVDESVLSDLVEEGIINDKQKKDLQFVVELGKLTCDNLSFIEALTEKKLKSAPDLASWENEDWKQLTYC